LILATLKYSQWYMHFKAGGSIFAYWTRNVSRVSAIVQSRDSGTMLFPHVPTDSILFANASGYPSF
jgi:hypothetical protein